MSKGARPQNCRVDLGPDSFGETKYAGETVVCGKWADALKARLERANIPCEKLFYRDWRRHMIEKVYLNVCVYVCMHVCIWRRHMIENVYLNVCVYVCVYVYI